MKPLFGFVLLTLAALSAAAALFRPSAPPDLEQHRSDAAGAVAYASLLTAPDAPPAPGPAPTPTPPPQPIRAENSNADTTAEPAVASESPSSPALISPPPAAPTAPAVRPPAVAPTQPLNSGATRRVFRRP